MPRILIADDNADLVAILASRFRAIGFDVHEASNGARALESAAQHKPDIIVLDVMMPELNGYQVCRRLKEDAQLKAIPVILLTAKDSEADQFWGFEVGADLYLTKPIDPASVVTKVQRLLQPR
jgi:DNA-binding response OmpR family regulator